MHSVRDAMGEGLMVVETSRDVDWVIVADHAQESVARMILARAVLNGVKTALVLSESRRRYFIQLYPVLSMAKAAGFTCPITRESLSAARAGEEGRVEPGSSEITPVTCHHCGETHAWARKDVS